MVLSYSTNPAYPHPPNDSSYFLMPGTSSHMAAGGFKYKPIPAGNHPAGFGIFANLSGYPLNPQGPIGFVSGLDDSARSNTEMKAFMFQILSFLAPPAPTEVVNQVDLLDALSRKTGSDAPASAHESAERPLHENKMSTSPRDFDSYVDIGLVQNCSTSYTPAEPQERQGHSVLSSFQGYDP
ncbi:hypothetical protein MKW98_032755 [Papaver atlanticum]|uniref:Uncharacterized protein n=1 Tax=Papaver atlanticum TaxID=357466 RepID=A0AAD4S091_9MAGN|nr:hypothetical protein MKW98_032755 [Papaver atlanticum]